jgi:hypothetical protein
MRLKAKSFSVSLPWGLGGINLDVSEAAEKAAWALYLELNTRVATKPLEKGEGSVREAMTSLYNLFEITREILKAGGVEVAKARGGRQSLGTIAMSFLNEVVRPSLVTWHTSFSSHEADTWKNMIEQGKAVPNNPGVASALVDESAWSGYDTFYPELEQVQAKLRKYVAILGAIAGVTDSPDVTLTENEETQ